MVQNIYGGHVEDFIYLFIFLFVSQIYPWYNTVTKDNKYNNFNTFPVLVFKYRDED